MILRKPPWGLAAQLVACLPTILCKAIGSRGGEEGLGKWFIWCIASHTSVRTSVQIPSSYVKSHYHSQFLDSLDWESKTVGPRSLLASQ